MAEVVNLRVAKKQRRKVKEAETAAARRAIYGRTRGQKELEAAEAEKAERDLDGKKLEPAPEKKGAAE